MVWFRFLIFFVFVLFSVFMCEPLFFTFHLMVARFQQTLYITSFVFSSFRVCLFFVFLVSCFYFCCVVSWETGNQSRPDVWNESPLFSSPLKVWTWKLKILHFDWFHKGFRSALGHCENLGFTNVFTWFQGPTRRYVFLTQSIHTVRKT